MMTKNRSFQPPTSKSRPETWRRPSIRISVILLSFLILAIVFIFLTGMLKDKQTAGTVNGHAFYQEEMKLYQEQKRAAVAAEFSARYQLDSFGQSFWQTDFDGRTPEQALYEEALAALVRDKVIQQEAVSRGIPAPLDFREMKKAWKLESDDRAQQTNNQSPVYGPQGYSLFDFQQYLMTDTANQLKRFLLENEWKPDEQKIRDAFSRLPESMRKADFTASGYVFEWEPLSDTPADEIIRKAVQEGADPVELPALLRQELPHLQCEPFSVSSHTIHREDIAALSLAEELSGLAPGEFSQVTGTGRCRFYLVTEKEGGGLLTFDDAPEWGRNKWVNDQFEQLIAEQTEAAVVVLSQ